MWLMSCYSFIAQHKNRIVFMDILRMIYLVLTVPLRKTSWSSVRINTIFGLLAAELLMANTSSAAKIEIEVHFDRCMFTGIRKKLQNC